MNDVERNTLLRRVAELGDEVRRIRGALEGRRALSPVGPGEHALLRFRAGDHLAAVLAREVERVVPVARCVPLPEAPPWVFGLLDVQGTLVPVIDVAARFGARRERPALADSILLLRASSSLVGLLVPGAPELVRATGEAVEAVPADAPAATFVRGVVRCGGETTLLLSPATLVETCEHAERAP